MSNACKYEVGSRFSHMRRGCVLGGRVAREFSYGRQKSRQPSRAAARGCGSIRIALLLDLTDTLASFGLRGLDLEPVLLGSRREKPPDAACQPVAFMISARLAPFGRPISSRIFAPLVH